MATTRRTGCLPTPSDPTTGQKRAVADPVVLSVPYYAPDQVYAALAGGSAAPFSILFDGGFQGGGDSAYIALDPVYLIESIEDRTRVNGRSVTTGAFGVMAELLDRYQAQPLAGLPPFQGGLAGYWGYELGRALERLPHPKPCAERLSDMMLGLFDTVIAFDCAAQSSWVIAHDLPGIPDRLPAEMRAEQLAKVIGSGLPKAQPLDWTLSASVRPDMTAEAFKQAVRDTVDYIRAGDIFQANMTQRFAADRPMAADGWLYYQRLKSLTPAPYAAYLDLGEDGFIASASPECFLKLDDQGRIETRPIKGTRPRGASDAEDRMLIDELRSSEKDRAENLMIVDLLRNDLSRVCPPGTVRVPKLFDVESFSAVHHLVSTVTGSLGPGHHAAALMAACFPGGSVTGAPKIRAMEIINALEPTPRGPYCGSIGWMGFSGAMESSIVIRTLIGYDDRIVAQAGCGIVADSDPDQEYAECMDKARALIQAIEGRPKS